MSEGASTPAWERQGRGSAGFSAPAQGAVVPVLASVLPIAMNTKDQITADMAANGVRTPFLIEDGTMSTAYGAIGEGMHAGLPGHSFVLIAKSGNQRWYGEYPSIWLSNADLLKEVRSQLTPNQVTS